MSDLMAAFDAAHTGQGGGPGGAKEDDLLAQFNAHHASGSQVDDSPRGLANVGLHHGLQGLTMGFSDELGGLGTAGLQALTNALPKSVADKLDLTQASTKEAYKSSRDDERALLAKQAEEHPDLATGAEIAGGLAGGLALPVARVGSGAAGLIGSGALTGAGYGALAGVGTSTEDTASGLAGDALKGGVMGGALGAAGGLVGAGAQKLSQFAGGKLSGALAKGDEMAAKEFGEKEAALRGSLGGESQKGSRTVEYLTDQEAKGLLSPEEQDVLDALKQSGSWDRLVRGVTKGKLTDAPAQMDAIEAKAAALKDFQGNKDQFLKNRAAELTSPAEAGRQVMARVARYGPVIAGGVLGKAAGVVAEPGTGFLAGAGIRPALKAVGRAISHPSVQVPIYSAMGKVGELLSSNPQALGKFGGALTSIAEQHGPEAAAAAHFVMSQSNPEYQKLAQGEGGGE